MKQKMLTLHHYLGSFIGFLVFGKPSRHLKFFGFLALAFKYFPLTVHGEGYKEDLDYVSNWVNSVR
jgi:hypothetical protein